MGSGPSLPPKNGGCPSIALILVRYGIGAVMVLAGIVMIAVNPGDWASMASLWRWVEVSPLLINYLFRVSVSSNRDREREEEARRYFVHRV